MLHPVSYSVHNGKIMVIHKAKKIGDCFSLEFSRYKLQLEWRNTFGTDRWRKLVSHDHRHSCEIQYGAALTQDNIPKDNLLVNKYVQGQKFVFKKFVENSGKLIQPFKNCACDVVLTNQG